MVHVSAPPPPPPDPALKAEKEQAQENLVASLGRESQGDMASLMARYGSQLAIAQGAGSITGGEQTPAKAGPFGPGLLGAKA